MSGAMSTTWFKVSQWHKKYTQIESFEVTKSTDKTVWYLPSCGTAHRELIESAYYKWFETLEEAKAEIDRRISTASEKKRRERLNEAAPALLEALEGLYQMVQENYHVFDDNMKFVNAAYAAIAAAKGES